MRKIYLLSGVPGAGKTTFIKENKLENYTISSDNLRLQFGSPLHIYDKNTNQVIDGMPFEQDKLVWNMLYSIVEERMKNSSTTIVDATHVTRESLKKYKDLSKKYNYKLHLVKFGRDLPISEFYNRNKNRGLRKVPDYVIERMYKNMKKFDKSKHGINNLSPEEMLQSLDWRESDLDKYEKIQFIGDIHSSGTALEELMRDYNQSTFYVFCGDYFDRGIEPVKTMEILLRLMKEKNSVFIKGNHEQHLDDYLSGNKYSSYFKDETLSPLLKAGYTRTDFVDFSKKLQPIFIGNFAGKRLIATHAGLHPGQYSNDDYLKNLALTNDDMFIYGIGGYDIDVDNEWDNEEDDVFQFHGHRNIQLRPVITGSSNQKSFNLEQKVEHGNDLAAITLTKDCDTDRGFSIEEKLIENKIYNEKFKPYTKFSEKYNFFSMKRDRNINANDLGNGITVLNFKPHVFRKKLWTDETVTARGLFVNEANEVVARGYNKFFNIDEMSETRFDKVAEKMSNKKFLLTKKENGFLAIVSYIPELGGLQVFSKGAGKDYSEMAKDILIENLQSSNHTFNELEEYIRKDFQNGDRYSITMEVINNELDPHIVSYDNNKVVILDVVDNNLKENLREPKADVISKKFNLERRDVLKSEYTIADNNSLYLLCKTKEDATKLLNELFSLTYEGVVIMFEDGFKTKVKTDYYKTLKYARGTIENLSKDPEIDIVKALKSVVEKRKNTNKKPTLLEEMTTNHLISWAEKIEKYGKEEYQTKDIFGNRIYSVPKLES
ncbi:hypothetical protein BG261_00820 [Floricoccus tropicus]|uniref:Serine/threonine protein phosphatase n=1 Tax=Floricoccus tropicus TaxID=1859473 RepID=A0A1E8GQE3_9LACT|nr:RNA ligase [Floricoccus tropicus]OFI50455.1 hypothetical protein BG261_00820 [Floricoccus tropicus]